MGTRSIFKYYTDCPIIQMIETDTETFYIDVFEDNGIPANLSGATAFFHLMEFSTRTHIWTKECSPIRDSNGGANVNYPYTVAVTLAKNDTLDLEGHYIGQLELSDIHGTSKFPFQIEIIISKKASE